MEGARVPTSEQLMAEMGWVRRLARALVKDDALADDIAQDTWLVAIEEEPDVDRPLRPWLGRVVANLVRTRRRSARRREDRHAALVDDRIVPTPADLIERVELQRAIAEELLALSEPYRSTVLLHFVEGCSSAELARRLGIPGGTVRRRLKVALDQLRDALRKRTDRPARGWLAALVPFARGPGPTPASRTLEVLAMKKVMVVVALVLAFIGGGVAWHMSGRTRQAGTATAPGAATTYASSVVGGTPAASLIPAWLTDAGAPARRIAGRVVFHGIPIEGARVELGFAVSGEMAAAFTMPDSLPQVLRPVKEVFSAADGTFDLGVQPPAVFSVSAASPNFAGVAVSVANGDPRVKSDQLVLALGDCRARLTGKVYDASAGPIAKARIAAAGLSGAESDADGKYAVCLMPRHALGTPTAEVRIEADGYGTIRQDVIAVGPIHVDFKLVPEAVLIGRVTTSDGKPVAGARVVAHPSLPSALRAATGWAMSDRDGKFRIAALAPAAFVVSADARGLGTAQAISVVAKPTGTSHEIELVLEPLAEVRGHLFMDGGPVAGATVMAVQADRVYGGGTSQADGSFVLTAVPHGATRFVAPPYRVATAKEITIDRAVVDGVRIDVEKMATVRGHVTRRGSPVAGADVMYMAGAQPTSTFGPPPFARTDATGAFVMEGIPPGPGRFNAWDNASKAFSEWLSVDLGRSDDRTIDIELTCSGEVQGTVVDEAGKPVGGVYVRMDITGGLDDLCEAMTDASGQFDCAMLTGGTYRPTVSPLPGGKQGFAPAKGDQLETIDVPKDGAIASVTISIKNERLAVRGSVVDDTGTPVPDVQVEAIGRGLATMDAPSTMSDAEGHFMIENLARGAYMLRARASDGSDTEVRGVAAGGEPVTIRIARAGALEGTLVGFTTAAVVFANAQGPGSRMTRIDVDGTRFSQRGLPPGRYTVEAQAGLEVDGQAVDVRSGETTKVTLHSRGTGTVEGTVADFATHAPLAGMRCDAKVRIIGETNMVPPDVSYQAFTDATGHFSVNAPIGRVRIVCFVTTGDARSAAGGDVEVAPGTAPKINTFSVRATFGATPGNAGFMFAPTDGPMSVGGVLPGGPAAASGLHAGDQIVTIDGVSVEGLLPDAAMALIWNHRPGSIVTLGVSRGGVVQDIKITVGKPPT